MSENNGSQHGGAAWPSASGDSAVPQWASPAGGASEPATPFAAPGPAPASAPLPPPPAPHLPPGAGPTAPGPQYSIYKPGIIVLRPLNFGEILDGAIKAIRHNPKVMVGLNGLVVIAATVALAISSFGFFSEVLSFDPFVESTDFDAATLVTFYVGAFFSSLILTLVTAISSISVGRSVIGRVIPVREAFTAAIRRFPTVIAMTLLMSLGLVAIMTVVVLIIVMSAALSAVMGIIVGILLGLGSLVLVVWVSIKLAIAIPAAVLERLGPIKAIARSWRLTAKRFWMIFSVLLVASIITSIIQQVIGAPVSLFAPLLMPQNSDSVGALFVVLFALSTFIGLLIATVFLASVTAVIYTDQRMRREGFDLVLTRAAQEQ